MNLEQAERKNTKIDVTVPFFCVYKVNKRDNKKEYTQISPYQPNYSTVV